MRAAALVSRDPRLPRPLRWLAAFGVLPVPGPVDEAALVLVALVAALLYRDRLRAAWREAATS